MRGGREGDATSWAGLSDVSQLVVMPVCGRDKFHGRLTSMEGDKLSQYGRCGAGSVGI